VRIGQPTPIVFIGHPDEPGGPLIEQGAVECLLKPFGDFELSEARDLVFASDWVSPNSGHAKEVSHVQANDECTIRDGHARDSR
jgi:hypothetical protein